MTSAERKEEIAGRIAQIKNQLPLATRLLAVSKYHTCEDIEAAYDAGQRLFGESRVQELELKHAEVTHEDIEWHFIGHLQRNKVKYIAPYVKMIHAVDSMRLMQEINKQGQTVGRTIDCLLEVHVAQEESKFGFTPESLVEMLEEGEWKSMPFVRICGIMGMASNTDDRLRILADFETLKATYDQVKASYFSERPSFCELSMGMTHDFPIAVEQGSTMVRVGSGIFAETK